jgi:hypothetical protein
MPHSVMSEYVYKGTFSTSFTSKEIFFIAAMIRAFRHESLQQ